MYESDTFSENAAYHMQVSSRSSQWRKCIDETEPQFHKKYVESYLQRHVVTETTPFACD